MEIYHPRDEELLREMKRVRRSDRRRRLCRGLIILLTLSIAVGLFVFLRYYQLAVAHGTGMGDTLPEGSLLLIRKPEAGQVYNAGDIILYCGGSWRIHRQDYPSQQLNICPFILAITQRQQQRHAKHV